MRNRIPLGPFYINFSQGRFTSWGVKIGRFSRNFTTGPWPLNTPGPGSVHGGRKRR
ncbi:MAG: hypothetical protein L0I24_06840 [Pseudonocardia sp.]|nr:hypothetical protein [Pseudonocardia sp.]